MLHLSTKEILDLLAKDKDIVIEHFSSIDDFSLSTYYGSVLRNDSYALSCLLEYIKNFDDLCFFDEDEEEHTGLVLVTLSTEEIFKRHGYEVLSESPLEVSLVDKTDSLATMEFAKILFHSFS